MESMAQKVFFWTYIAVITLICVLGICGNVLSLIVLLQKRMRSSTSCILVGLVISDMLILISGLLINSIGIIVLRVYFDYSLEIGCWAVIVFRVFYPLKKIGKFKQFLDFRIWVVSLKLITLFLKITIFVFTTGNLASVYITILITIERYVAVCWPFHAKTLLTLRNSIWYTTGIIIASGIYNFPRFFEKWEVQLGNSSVLESTSSAHEATSSYIQYSHGWGKTTVHYIIPFIILVFLNFQIYRKVQFENWNMICNYLKHSLIWKTTCHLQVY